MSDLRRRERERRSRVEGSLASEEALLRERVRVGELTEQGFRLHLLMRRWQTTRDPTDEAMMLAEQVQGFALPPTRLRLAAALGHSPAEVALGLLGRKEHGEAVDELLQAVDLATHRAADVAARLLQRRAQPSPEGQRTADEILAPLEAWLVCPCSEHLTAAHDAGRVHAAVYGGCLATRDDAFLSPIRSALFSAGPLESSFGWQTTWGHRSQSRLEHAQNTLRAARSLGEVELHGAIRDELAPWLLGQGDPLTERVRAHAGGGL